VADGCAAGSTWVPLFAMKCEGAPVATLGQARLSVLHLSIPIGQRPPVGARHPRPFVLQHLGCHQRRIHERGRPDSTNLCESPGRPAPWSSQATIPRSDTGSPKSRVALCRARQSRRSEPACDTANLLVRTGYIADRANQCLRRREFRRAMASRIACWLSASLSQLLNASGYNLAFTSD
jgi:hypothetical protein